MTERILACMACGNVVADADQRTCPHCLEALRVRTFASPEAYQGFLADRREHGAHVDPVRRAPRRGYALALWFFAAVMLLAAGGILVVGLNGDLGVGTLSTLSAAVVPLGMGVALFEVARRVGGGAR